MTTRAGSSRTGRLALARGAAAVCALGLAGRSQGARVHSAVAPRAPPGGRAPRGPPTPPPTTSRR
ncbi:hypothetical protein ABZT48_39535, partial [Streptomyces avermitilis]|uniref:hypothetical protein n=1 Tax=Streptomyces avermitilis TaxID=33903 RepID=UPI0033AD3BB0